MSKVQVLFPDGRKVLLDAALARSPHVVAMGARIIEPLPRQEVPHFEEIKQKRKHGDRRKRSAEGAGV